MARAANTRKSGRRGQNPERCTRFAHQRPLDQTVQASAGSGEPSKSKTQAIRSWQPIITDPLRPFTPHSPLLTDCRFQVGPKVCLERVFSSGSN